MQYWACLGARAHGGSPKAAHLHRPLQVGCLAGHNEVAMHISLPAHLRMVKQEVKVRTGKAR